MMATTHSSGTTTQNTTHGFVLNWGWSYDALTKVLSPIMFRGSERSVRQLTADVAQFATGEHVLDVGCGTGTFTVLAKERVGETGSVCGVDPAPRQLASARRKAAARGLAIDFQPGVIEQLPCPDRAFDAVVSSLMMHHLPDDLKFRGLAEIARVLKPGGRLLVVDMNGPVGPWKSRLSDLPALMRDAGFADAELLATRFRGLGIVRGRIEAEDGSTTTP